MDEVSLAETTRLRLRQLRLGVLSGKGRCDRDPDKLVQLNLSIITGDRGLQVCSEFVEMLKADPNGNVWHGEVQMRYTECAPKLLMSMCDSWRRLHLMYKGLPWECFRMVNMDASQGLSCFRELHASTGNCTCCRDPLFFQVARLYQCTETVWPVSVDYVLVVSSGS